MTFLYNAQNLVLLILGVAALGMHLFALVDVIRRPAPLFVAAGKRTKNFWLIIIIVCSAVGFVSLTNVIGFVGLLAIVGSAVYLADVRPALQSLRGGGGSSGPYGTW